MTVISWFLTSLHSTPDGKGEDAHRHRNCATFSMEQKYCLKCQNQIPIIIVSLYYHDYESFTASVLVVQNSWSGVS